MKMIRQSIWATLILGAVLGCAGQDEETQPPVPSTINPGTKPGTPAAAIQQSDKGPMSSEMLPPPSKAESKPDESKKTDESKKDDGPKVEGPKADNTRTNDAAAKVTAEELAAIKELPASEQDAALKQFACPVSGEHLGSMGKPRKVTAAGRTFYLCCEGCEKDVKDNPQAVIAKLDKKGDKQ